MKYRNISFAAAACAVFVPVLCQAGPEGDALNACAQAFASSLAGPGAPVVAYKVNHHSNQSGGSMLDLYSRTYTFELHANDSKTGAAIARASCSTDIRGAVLTLSPVRF